MQKSNKFCQSCGMPMKKDPKKRGSNSDRSINQKYCSYCFEKGEFIQADISLQEMQVFVKGKMKEMGFPGFLTGFFAKGISKLERWQ